ncbi:unknown transmembrane protein [Mesoplasma florum L1]|uniref:ABC transporter permease n=1 Tax=Mesoplasma florum (strain ATCC 33453 / NBRC 100688 / NCTC 11704 / L1) TaxID=265311 RepID=Q6F0V8_MESFL|nr:hypothetical protein [Mesoplasma florum]AAT75865.1 unknown transmembrane protein [Mesoplasma florum L1]AVN61171.1 hypothetical protein CG005_02700 [Mesoplasma florum]
MKNNYFTLKKQSVNKWFSNNYSVSDWKFWFKLSFVIILFAVLLMSYLKPIIDSSIYVKQINDILNNPETNIKTVEELITFAEGKNYDWLIITKVNGENVFNIISTINFTVIGEAKTLHANYQPFEEIWFRTSFFTLLSNILVLVWMTTSFIKPKSEGEKGLISTNGAILTATFITITFLIYQLSLRPTVIATSLGNGESLLQAIFPSVTSVIENEVFHTFGPIAFVLYVILGMNHDSKENISTKFLHKNWMQGIITLISYGVYAILRGLLKESGGTAPTSMYAYPYFFLQITTPAKDGLLGIPGVAWFFMFVVIIAGIYIGFSTLYRYLIIKRIDKMNK